jgi:NAD(P)-dependent dehydrogenase (short-subunit alcohol dehydrogenase family)
MPLCALRRHRRRQPGPRPAGRHRRLGGIDLVIYLAGDYVPMRADNFDLAVAEQVVAVNFNGAMRLAAAVLPDLHPGGGIAFVASVAGYRGLPKALCYGPGKAALIHFAECLHLDLAPRGIGVWAINPGFVSTRSPPRTISPCPPCRRRAGGAGHHRRLCRGAFRDSLPQALHPPAQVFRHPALPLVFPAYSPFHRRLT